MNDLGPEAREAIRQMKENISTLTRRARVLIVDDSHNDCILLRHALQEVDRDMIVHFAHSELDAERACEKERYDVVFLDLLFPEGAGALMLGATWARNSGHVIVLTGADAGSIPVEQARQAGAKVIFTKPVDKTALRLIFHRIPNGQT